jgi:hypothetical protein
VLKAAKLKHGRNLRGTGDALSKLIFSYCRDDEPNLCGPLTIKVASNGFTVAWNTYVQEQWLADLGARLQAYPLPGSGIASRLKYGDDEVFAVIFLPQGSLGAITATVKVADVIAGLSQRAEVKLGL